MLLSDVPTGTHSLSISLSLSLSISLPVLPPSAGEWSLITVHGLYDEMPLAHLTSSCQLPLTSHYLQYSFSPAILLCCGMDSHLEWLESWWAFKNSNNTFFYKFQFCCGGRCFCVNESNLFSWAVNRLQILKVNDVDYSVKPDDTLKARERVVQLVT